MVTFIPGSDATIVLKGNTRIGYITKNLGFFIGPATTISRLTEIPSEDLRRIADEVDLVQKRLTLQDKLVLKVLSESGRIVSAILNSFTGILTRAEVEASVEKLEKLGKVERISSGKDPIYTAHQAASA
jgi:hypothetical protein